MDDEETSASMCQLGHCEQHALDVEAVTRAQWTATDTQSERTSDNAECDVGLDQNT